jgi:hypothetical protein
MVMFHRKRKSGLRKRRATKRSSKRPTASAISHSLNKLQKKEVKKLIKGPEETKLKIEPLFVNSKFNSLVGELLSGTDDTFTTGDAVINSTTSSTHIANGASVVNDWYRAIPLLNQGLTSYTRIGKKVTPVSCHIDLQIKFDKDDALTRDIWVVFWMVTPRVTPVYPGIQSAPVYPFQSYTFLDAGQGQNVSFNGSYQGQILPVDKEGFHLHKHHAWRLCKSSGKFNGSGIISAFSGSTSDGKPSIGGEHVERHFKIRVPLPKTLMYDQENSATPSNTGPVWSVGYYYANGTNPDVSTNGIMYMNAITTLRYKDV